jgi:acetolactate synthase I/II/III large subunit
MSDQNTPQIDTARIETSKIENTRIGGHILADGLAVQGVTKIFGVPGESYLAVLDGLYAYGDNVEFIICRQEGGAGFMADAYAKLTGKPGVLMVTRGPGASNAAIAIHSAHQDSVPLIVLIGQVGNEFVEREAFQEVDYRRMFGQMTKWVAQIDRADRIPEYLAHAFQVAQSGRMGPVVLALPEDMLIASACVLDAKPVKPVRGDVSAAQITELSQMLGAAKNPFIVLGGTGWTSQACADLRYFLEANSLSAGCAFRYQDLLSNHHPNYVGDVGIGINPKLAARVKNADLVIAIGPLLGEMTTSGYTLLEVPYAKQKLIHIHAGLETLGRVYQADMMINAGMPEIARALRNVLVGNAAWRDNQSSITRTSRSDYEAWQLQPPIASKAASAKLNLWQCMQVFNRLAPKGTVVTNGAGNFATWAHRFYRYDGLENGRTQLAPTSGAMGYGIPAAVAASIALKGSDTTVVCFAGDGDFLMTGQELATAAQYGVGFIVLLFNNGMYGTIRMHQEREYPARVSGTQLKNPSFTKYAEAFGGVGISVETTDEFEDAFTLALELFKTKKQVVLIELKMDPQAITPNASIEEIRQVALKKAG